MRVKIRPTEKIIEFEEDNMIMVSKKSLERLLIESFFVFSEQLKGIQDLNEQELNERCEQATSKLLQLINSLGKARKGELFKQNK